jgi:hypothetical protein
MSAFGGKAVLAIGSAESTVAMPQVEAVNVSRFTLKIFNAC